MASEKTDEESSPQYIIDHFYFGGRLGWASFNGACEENSISCTDDTLGFGLYGGYQYNSWLAFEGGAIFYGSPDSRYSNGSDVSVNIYDSQLSLKLSLPITDNIDLFSRVGGSYQFIDKKVSSSNHSLDGNTLRLLNSFGLDYRLNKYWSLRGEYQFIDGIGSSETNKADEHFTSIGITYHFGQQKNNIKHDDSPPPRYVTIQKPVTITAQTLFKFDSSELINTFELDLLVEQLKNYPDDIIEIVGHTDNVGTESYNTKLSLERAQSVANYIVDQGIDAKRLSIDGRGASEPVASNDTSEGRAANRRVEIRLDSFEEESVQLTDYVSGE
ncbi:MAG: OmpA family protein [Vibrio sp.]|uniref:OmpA family protein n=1 Tax=Vibrio sp. TaxID=678 RepID=UPI003A8B5488